MRTSGTVRRIVAAQLLIVAPLVTGGRLALDIHSIPDGQSHVEVEHSACCATAHDHRLCTLVYQSPWSPASPAPRIAHCALPVYTFLSPAEIEYDDASTRLQRARAPPTSF
jgi:hypothetical protein